MIDLKRSGALVLCIILWVLPLAVLRAQDYTQTINKTARFANTDNTGNELRVYNINGSVTVEGYEGDEILVTAREEIDGTPEEVSKAKDELEFVVEQERNHVLVYLNAPFINICKEDHRINYHIDRWNNDYDFLFDITIKVPQATHIYASTINSGNVRIEHTTGNIHAFNVNGKVSLDKVTGPTEAHTVNGNITARYSQSPGKDSEYQTVNGTIDVSYPKDLSADIRFKSFHGDLYTDFEHIEQLKARVEQDKKRNHGGITYHIDRFSPIRIGKKGGPTFRFQVLNGDVYIKQIKS